MTGLTVAAVGVHVLDVHVLGVTAIPEGSAGSLVDSIGMSPAGTAAGTAVVFSRLGASVRTLGARRAPPDRSRVRDADLHQPWGWPKKWPAPLGKWNSLC